MINIPYRFNDRVGNYSPPDRLKRSVSHVDGNETFRRQTSGRANLNGQFLFLNRKFQFFKSLQKCTDARSIVRVGIVVKKNFIYSTFMIMNFFYQDWQILSRAANFQN